MKAQHLQYTARAASLAISGAVLAGCGGGGGDSATSTAPTTASTLGGTVASGAPEANVIVTLIDSAGHTATATADVRGAFSNLSLSGMAAPLVLVATDPSGQNAPLISMLPTVQTGSASATANVTTLTTAMAALLTSDGNPLDLIGSGQASALISTNAVTKAMNTLDAALASILTANQMTATGYDPVATPFAADRTGADAALDAFNLLPASGATLLVPTADPTQSLALNNRTSASPAPLPAPPASTPANYVDYLQSALQGCFGSTTTCTTGVAPSFLENGFSSLNAEYSVMSATSSAGAAVSLPKTLRFYQINGVWHADVKFDYTLPNGQTGSILTTVQQQAIQLPDGSTQQWEIIGNQLRYDVTIRSTIVRRMFEQPNQVSNYEAGLELRIPQGGVNAPVNSVFVTGPGLLGGVWLERRGASGNSNMAIPGTPPATAPATATTTTSNTNIFRWSWEAVDSSQTYSLASPTPSYYASQQVDLSAIALFASYTVTLYDTSGAQLAQLAVTNEAAPFDSSMGAKIVWSALAGTTASDVLSPSGALAAAQTSVPITWTNIASGQASNIALAPPITNLQIQSATEPNVSPAMEVDGFATGLPIPGSRDLFSTTVTAGVNQNGTQTCTSPCPFPALAPGYYRNVQLDWTQHLAKVYDIFQYND